MNKKILLAAIVVLISGAVMWGMNQNSGKKNTQQITDGEKMATKEVMDTAMTYQKRYLDYSKPVFEGSPDKKRVYFFHAKWCPTCKAAHEEFMQNSDKIPTDVILFKTDYDTEKELKAKYGITYQHTFVYVDSQGKEIKKWNGGGISELMSNTAQ